MAHPTPDPINQTIVAVPIILYEIGILFARFGTKAQEKSAEAVGQENIAEECLPKSEASGALL